MSTKVSFCDLGLIDYKPAWDIQEKLFAETIQQKLNNRNAEPEKIIPTSNYLLLCEHPHVYTIGKSGKENNLLIDEKYLERIGAKCYNINRGGDITYHGPGQIVGYPIFDLDYFYSDIHRYMRDLEEVIIRVMKEYSLDAKRLNGATGVWLEPENPPRARKICAMGVRASRWVTMHGFSLNINTDLKYFNYINPCGFTDKGVTSVSQEINSVVDAEKVKVLIKKHFEEVFDVNFINFKISL